MNLPFAGLILVDKVMMLAPSTPGEGKQGEHGGTLAGAVITKDSSYGRLWGQDRKMAQPALFNLVMCVCILRFCRTE